MQQQQHETETYEKRSQAEWEGPNKGKGVCNTPTEGQYDKHGRSNRVQGRDRTVAVSGNYSATGQW